MTLQSTEADNITIILVNQHLRILNDEESFLIERYITASLGAVEDYMHEKALKSIYVNTADELIPIDGSESDLLLYLEVNPRSIEITSNLGTETLDERYYVYADNYIYIPGVDGRTITEVKVNTGKYKHSAQIIQARLLLIGSYYEFRENTVPLRLSTVPDGVAAILGNCSEAAL